MTDLGISVRFQDIDTNNNGTLDEWEIHSGSFADELKRQLKKKLQTFNTNPDDYFSDGRMWTDRFNGRKNELKALGDAGFINHIEPATIEGSTWNPNQCTGNTCYKIDDIVNHNMAEVDRQYNAYIGRTIKDVYDCHDPLITVTDDEYKLWNRFVAIAPDGVIKGRAALKRFVSDFTGKKILDRETQRMLKEKTGLEFSYKLNDGRQTVDNFNVNNITNPDVFVSWTSHYSGYALSDKTKSSWAFGNFFYGR